MGTEWFVNYSLKSSRQGIAWVLQCKRESEVLARRRIACEECVQLVVEQRRMCSDGRKHAS